MKRSLIFLLIGMIIGTVPTLILKHYDQAQRTTVNARN